MKYVRGFSLLEVLIAVLVLSIGLLGMAGLQLNSLKFNESANVRSQATTLAYDVTDRMRANRAAARAGDYVTGLSDTTITGTSRSKIDLQQWKAEIGNKLPDGKAAIAVAGDIATVTIQWDESRIPGGGNQQQLVFETRL